MQMFVSDPDTLYSHHCRYIAFKRRLKIKSAILSIISDRYYGMINHFGTVHRISPTG